MRKIGTVLLAALMLALLWGCEKVPDMLAESASPEERAPETTQAEETIPATIPADGNPGDVTCKGSYTTEGDPEGVAAVVDGSLLTNELLQVYYWAEAAQYRQENHETAPDFDRPLDTQICQIDSSVNSWQQYFLKQALNTWHTAQALTLQAYAEGVEPEEAYQPNLVNHAKYMTNMPAMAYHYSRNLESYQPNTLHQAYLEQIPDRLEQLARETGCGDADALALQAFGTSAEALGSAMEMYNRGYMYFTELSYGFEEGQEETAVPEGETEICVDVRHILMVPDDLVQKDDTPSWQKKDTVPVVLEAVQVAQDGTVSCSEEAWEAGRSAAEALLKKWRNEWNHSEATFAQLARYNSDDPGTVTTGGLYRNLRKGQLLEVLDQWCFDPARQPGDTTVLRSEYGYHILYFSGSRTLDDVAEETQEIAEFQKALIESAREAYPMTVHYGNICLAEAEALVSFGDMLYPDVAHQRYPEAPLYLQQDYPKTMYGGYEIRTNGCGITTMSMLATYMTDEEYTPPEMCARYGHYSFSNGTDGRIFQLEAPVLGFYCKEKTYDPRVAKQALADGYPVVSLQHKGYWTRGGHYLLVEKMNEDGTVQVRDSNIFNYSKLEGHDVDSFQWSLIPANGSAFWIFEKKVTAIPACERCGAPEGVTASLLQQDYTCEKCEKALLRRDTYLNAN